MIKVNAHYATGTSGTIGRHLLSTTQGLSIDLKDDFSQVDFKYPIKGANVTHLAGIVGDRMVRENPAMAREVNVNGTLRLAERLLELNIGRFTFVSTSHVYSKSEEPIKEDWAVNPSSEYANQKLETECALRYLFKNTSAQLTILRIFSILDWNVKDFSLGGAVRNAFLSNGKNPVHFADDVRDFLTPRTVATILEKIAQTNDMSGIWNICSGNGLTIRSAGIKMIGDAKSDQWVDYFVGGNSPVPYLVGCNQKLLTKLPSNLFRWSPSKFSTWHEGQDHEG